MLCKKLRRHYEYFGIKGNSRSLSTFREAVTDDWRKWLSRSNRDRQMTRAIYGRLLERYTLQIKRVVNSV